MDEPSEGSAQGEFVMKHDDIETKIIAARPDDYLSKLGFTDSVMSKIGNSEILSSSVRKMSVIKKETFMMKLSHLPKLAIVAIVLGIFALLTGTAYAVVKTVESFSNVKINETSTNDFGRQQLNVTFNRCSDREGAGVTYELKRDSGLSTEDGAKTLQAGCDMYVIDDWFRINSTPELTPPFLVDQADTITSIGSNSIMLKTAGKKDLSDGVKIIAGSKEISKNDLKIGDTVFSYPDILKKYYPNIANQPLKIFVATQPVKYYSVNFQSYVNERGPCQNNPSRACLQASNINHTDLIVSRGAAWYSNETSVNSKEVQGKVISYNSNEIKMDVGGGIVYTILTPSNIVEKYNKVDVYKLAKLDGIYSKTDPEALKLSVGDSITITYVEHDNKSSDSIDWSQLLTIGLMVERIPNNLDVLRKY